MRACLTLNKKRENEKERLTKLKALETDPRSGRPGVLLSDDIKYYSENHNLIAPFDINHLKPAAYELTVGNEWYMGGKYFDIQEKPSNKTITIEPFDVVVIKTAETLCIPRFMIARWNIRVRFAYQGLLWVGGPQVDAGYKGHLFCPLYNLSDKPVRLHVGDEIAVIDFVKTCSTNAGTENVKYPDTPKKCIIQDYGIDDFQSALVTEAKKKLEGFEKTIVAIENKLSLFFTLTFAVLAIIVSALAVISARPGIQDVFGVPHSALLFVSLALSVLALGLSSVAVVGRPVHGRRNLPWLVCTGVIFVVFALGFVGYGHVEAKIDELSDRMNKIMPDSSSAPSETHAEN